MPLRSNRTDPSGFRRAGSAALLIALTCAVGIAALARAEEEAASEERGKGAPTIVLIHSLGGDRGDWARVAPRLARRHRVVLVDLPGHGRTPALEGAPTLDRVADAVEHVLSERKVKKAVLVGHSYGALVALQLALDHGKRVSKIVAIDAATFNAADSVQLGEIDQVLRERYPVFLQAVFGPMTNEPLRGDTLIVRASQVPQPVLTAYFHDAWREDLRARIKDLKFPVYLIATTALWPTAESWTSARKRLGYETRGPAVGYRVLNSGHVVAMDQPDTLAALIEAIARSAPRR